MDRFEKHALDIIRRGDEILNAKRKQSRIIRNTAFSLSGVCAVLIVGLGIIHNKELFDSVRKPFPDKSLVAELTTETTAYTTTDSYSDTTVVTTENSVTASGNSANTVTAVTTVQTESFNESLSVGHSTVTATGNTGVQNLKTTHAGNIQSAVSYTKTHTVTTTASGTSVTGSVSTAAPTVTTTVTTDEEGIPCTISQSTPTTTKMTTATAVTSTYELTLNTNPVLTKPTTVLNTAVFTTEVQTQPTTAQVTGVVLVTTIPTVLPGYPPVDSDSRFEWQRRTFIKTPYYADKENATDYLGNVGDNQIYSLGYNNAYICVLMLVDDNYVICVNEEYYEYVIEKILGGIV